MTVLPRTDDPDNVISTENFGRLIWNDKAKEVNFKRDALRKVGLLSLSI